MQTKQWQYGLTIVFGLLLLAMPFLLRFYDDIPVRSFDFYVIGAIMVAAGAAALHLRSAAASWVMPSLGLWMLLSPWLLGFMSVIEARNSAWMIGGAVFLLSGWALLERLSANRAARTFAG